MKPISMKVDKSGHGMRLDVFLASHIKGLSRRRAQRMIEDGQVLCEGRKTKKGLVLAEGQKVEITARITEQDFEPLPDDSINIDVVFENDQIIAISKPAGMHTVPLRAEEKGCVANFIAHRFPECIRAGDTKADAGLLSRLDSGTVGLVAAARTPETFAKLVEARRNKRIFKCYMAVCIDNESSRPAVQNHVGIDAGSIRKKAQWTAIRASLAASASDPARVVVADGSVPVRGMPSDSETRYAVLRKKDDLILVAASIHRGFRHQIRVHLAHEGLALASDPLYGRPHKAAGGTMQLFSWFHSIDTDHAGIPAFIEAHIPDGMKKLFSR